MNTEPRNKESYPRSLAHFQLQYRKKQAVVTENSGNTKILLAFPLVLCYMFQSSIILQRVTTIASFCFTLCQLEIRKTQTHFQVVLLCNQQPNLQQFTNWEDNKRAGRHKPRIINVFCQVPELLSQFDLQHPSPADFLKYKLNLRHNSLFWHHTLKILKGTKGVKLTTLNLPRNQLALWWPNTVCKRLVCLVNKSSRRKADLGLKYAL